MGTLENLGARESRTSAVVGKTHRRLLMPRGRAYCAAMRMRALSVSLAAALMLAGASSTSYAAERTVTTINVYHQAVSPISVSGSGIGTVRTFFIPMAVNGKAANDQYLSGTLTTFAENVSGGLELRGSNLTFVFGNEADQLVVGGISLYPPAASTLAANSRTVRPVLGGSGKYSGARGQVISTNMGERGWTHVFKITR